MVLGPQMLAGYPLMSGMVKYVIYGCGRGREFVDAFSHRSSGFFKEQERGPTIVDPSRDIKGNPITKNHPHYDLSKIILNFREGERTSMEDIINEKDIVNKNEANFEEYFNEKGPHFCVGYLSRFGEIVRSNRDMFDSSSYNFIPPIIKWALKKRKERPAYKSAKKVLQDLYDKNRK